MTTPGINFTVSKFYKPFWVEFQPVIDQLGYSKAINRAIQAQVKGLDIITIKEYCKTNPDFKRRLKEQLD